MFKAIPLYVCHAFVLFSELLILLSWSLDSWSLDSWSLLGDWTWARWAMRPMCMDVLHSSFPSVGVLLWSISACTKPSDSFEVNVTSGCKKQPQGTTDLLFHVSVLSGLHKPWCDGGWEMHQDRKWHGLVSINSRSVLNKLNYAAIWS